MTDVAIGFPPVPSRAFREAPAGPLRWRVLSIDGEVLARFRAGKNFAALYLDCHEAVRGRERELLYYSNGHWHPVRVRGAER